MEIKESSSEIHVVPEISSKGNLWQELGKQREAKEQEKKPENKSFLDKSLEAIVETVVQKEVSELTADNNPAKAELKNPQDTKEVIPQNSESPERPIFKLRIEKNEGTEKKAYQFMREVEGGFSDNPHDRGGRTNKGVTQKTYDHFRDQWGQKRADVKEIPDREVEKIYNNYWRSVKGDELPPRTAVQMCDFGYNSGSGTAIKELQGLLKDSGHKEVKCDGVIGPKTLSAIDQYVEKHGDKKLAQDLNDRRLDYLKGLKDWKHFGNGWTNRCKKVRNFTDSDQFDF